MANRRVLIDTSIIFSRRIEGIGKIIRGNLCSFVANKYILTNKS